jgi:enoyl-CoA hydratase/carnithine racemase
VTVELETRGDVALITLARPEKLNAINDEMLDGLLDAVEAIGRSEAIGAAVLTGRGRAFSAGGDIKAMDGMDDRTFAATISRYMRVSAAFRDCPKPIVAAIHGHALAGGFELALMCDVRFAARGARFGLPDTPLGLSPTSGMTWLLPRIVGLGRAMYLTLSADDIDAEEAERIGLVNRVVPAGDARAAARAIAAEIAERGPLAVRTAKRLLDASADLPLDDGLAAELEASVRIFATDDMLEGAAAFLGKRPPIYRGQ